MLGFIHNLFVPHAKNKYRPHLIRKHGLFVSVLLIVTMQLAYNYQVSGSLQVLGYATDVSPGALLSLTNQNRTANGQNPLTTSPALTTAAQNKAQHMIDNGYWAHVAPDGTTPWVFINAAGYAYSKAGENLAYGYATSADAVQGWMDSPSHRDNILTARYENVGFGIANGENFQGNENTVIVAMYGDPVDATPPPAPPATTTPELTIDPSPIAEEPAETIAEPEVAVEIPQLSIPAISTFGNSNDSPAIATSNLQALLNGNASWALYLTSLILVAIGSIYTYRHIIFIQTIIVRGEHIMHAHPLLEASMIYAAIWVVLSAQYGVIR